MHLDLSDSIAFEQEYYYIINIKRKLPLIEAAELEKYKDLIFFYKQYHADIKGNPFYTSLLKEIDKSIDSIFINYLNVVF